ncbi:MAG: hypothetical protein IPN71_03230 [Fibrobacteres bacterium]|nr:hypothetical protein [Fibrobacterota bacterium]
MTHKNMVKMVKIPPVGFCRTLPDKMARIDVDQAPLVLLKEANATKYAKGPRGDPRGPSCFRLASPSWEPSMGATWARGIEAVTDGATNGQVVANGLGPPGGCTPSRCYDPAQKPA